MSHPSARSSNLDDFSSVDGLASVVAVRRGDDFVEHSEPTGGPVECRTVRVQSVDRSAAS